MSAEASHQPTIGFVKMHGLGNDFLIFDWRQRTASEPDPLDLSRRDVVSELADRHTGVGFDQLIVMRAPTVSVGMDSSSAPADTPTCYMQIFNADGGEVSACGNATRCVGRILLCEHPDAAEACIVTCAGRLRVTRTADPSEIAVHFNPPRLLMSEIPLAIPASASAVSSLSSSDLHTGLAASTVPDGAVDPQNLHTVLLRDVERLAARSQLPMERIRPLLGDACAVSMGNPHLVLFSGAGTAPAAAPVQPVDDAVLATLGAALEHHALFPQRINVEFAVPDGAGGWRVRVWERGAGITRACGTGACAVLVAAVLRGYSAPGAVVPVRLDGGVLAVQWAGQAVRMVGPAACVYRGWLADEWTARWRGGATQRA